MEEASTEVVLARLRGVLEAAEQSLVVVDPDGRVVEINGAALRLGRRRREDVIGRLLEEIARSAGAAEDEIEAIRTAIAGTPARYVAVRGDRRTVVSAVPLETGGATFVSQGVAAYREEDARALSARLLAEAARALNDPAALDDTLEALADVLVPAWADSCLCALVEPDGTVRPVATRNTDDAVRAASLQMIPAHLDAMPDQGMLARAIAARTPVVIEDVASAGLGFVSDTASGQLQVCSVAVAPLIDHEALVGLIVLGTDARSGRRLRSEGLEALSTLADRTAAAIRAARLHATARSAEARFRAAFEHAPIGIALSREAEDGTLAFVEVNAAFCTIVGRERDDVLGRPLAEVAHPDHSGETRIARPDGLVRHVLAGSAQTGDGTVVTQLLDVSDRHEAQTELEHLASHDALTGLLNRRRFEESLEQELAHVHRFGDLAAVLTLDVDNFKHVNDNHGHAAGDAVLRAIADALRSRIRATDRVGRLGGDEFGVVLSRSGPQDARAVAEELLSGIRALRRARRRTEACA